MLCVRVFVSHSCPNVGTWLPIGFLGAQNILVAREKVRAYYQKVSGFRGVSR